MDLVGRFGGSKLIIKLIGQEEYDSALNLLQEKGMVYVPIMYLLPVFPDDAICMICGALKIKWWVHYLEILACRGIGCATIVFGIEILPKELVDNLTSFNWAYIGEHIVDYLCMLTVIVFWVCVVFTLGRIVDKWLSKKLKERRLRKEESNNALAYSLDYFTNRNNRRLLVFCNRIFSL